MDQQDALAPSSIPDHRALAGSRRYRSKAQRPCDVCRSRKVLCNIPDPSRPCQLCERIGRRCTFVGNPSKRQRSKNGTSQLSPSTSTRTFEAHGTYTSANVMNSSPQNIGTPDLDQDDQRGNELQIPDAARVGE